MEVLCKYEDKVHFNKHLLQHIRRKNKEKILSILKDANPSQLTDDTGVTLLHYAAKYGNVWLTKYLIELGANVDAPNNLKETPLMFAVKNYQTNTAELLLHAGADMYFPNQVGQCVLGKMFNDKTMAFSKNMAMVLRRHITQESLSSSKYVNSPTFHDDCPLHYFVPLNNVDVIRVLLKKGSPVNAKNVDTDTSLHLAVIQMDLEMVKVLLEYNADVNAETYRGYTPLFYLQNFEDQNKSLAMFHILMAAGASLIDYDQRKLNVAFLLLRGDRLAIRSLLNYQTDFNFWNFKLSSIQTPFHYVARNKNPNVFTELQDIDFNADIETHSDFTLLHSAAFSGNVTSIEFLLDRGYDINALSFASDTPLGYMIRKNLYDDSYESDYLKCIEIFLARGADPQIVTSINRGWFYPRTFTPITDHLIEIMNLVIPYLSLLEISGKEIEYYTHTVMLVEPQFKEAFEVKKVELAEMKETKLGKSVTLFDFMIASSENISLFARYRQLVPSSLSKIKTHDADPCYQRKLCENFSKFTRLAEMRRTYEMTLNTIIGKLFDVSVYNIAEKIVEHLEDHELSKIM